MSILPAWFRATGEVSKGGYLLGVILWLAIGVLIGWMAG